MLNLRDAVIDAGAVRFRPMLLTAAAVVVGAGVTLELLGGFNRSQLARVTPALHLELLL